MPEPDDTQAAIAKLQAAITEADGRLRPITRIDLEAIPDARPLLVRWTIWEGDRHLYTATGTAADLDGFLAASKMIFATRARDTDKEAPRASDQGD